MIAHAACSYWVSWHRGAPAGRDRAEAAAAAVAFSAAAAGVGGHAAYVSVPFLDQLNFRCESDRG
jgi:hypothetical protein